MTGGSGADITAAQAAPRHIQDVLTIDRPEQLKALGHPLRVRVLEMLGGESTWQLTNRELAQALSVDPGHLHFHVRMLLKAGLIELVPGTGGREKPYRAVARTFRVAPHLLASGPVNELHSAMLDEVQRGIVAHGPDGQFRAAQLTLRLKLERAMQLVEELVEQAREAEDDDEDTIVVTVFAHPPSPRDDVPGPPPES
ncbi:MAG: hypothetical protein QOE36_234 [Gaiellaceae bacterium]|nr:hypothetical protein [Gaiellaceae bacterium]